MAKGIKFHSYLIKNYLKDSERAAGYLREALLEGDLELLQAVVSDLIEAGYCRLGITLNQLDVKQETNNLLDTAEIELTEEAVKAKI